jgi:hypothetical protein
MRNDRGPWYLLTGVLLGAVLGLAYAWVISPVRFVDNPPSAMREDFKDQYRALIAVAFTSSHDLGRARLRLGLLADPDQFRALSAQAQRLVAGEGLPSEIRALGELAAAIGPGLAAATSPAPTGSPASPTSSTSETPATPAASGTAVPGTANPTSAPTASAPPTLTRTPLPTRTMTPTPGLPFELAETNDLCDPELAVPLIQIYAEDAAGNPVPGVAVLISWADGEEQIFTGLKPELGLGYADFSMEEGVTYAVQIPDGGAPVTDISAQECESPDGERYLGSWELVFRQP